MTIRKISAVLIATVLLFGAGLAQAADYKTTLRLHIANAGPIYDETYTLTVPEDFTITSKDWNSLGSITAKYSGSNSGFDSTKKLVITVTTSHDFKLTSSGGDTITYFVATNANDTSGTKTFEFSAAELNAKDTNDAFVGTSKTIGVNVENYSNKPAGDYTDEILYDVAVQDVPVKPITITVKWMASEITDDAVVNQNTMTKDNVTLVAGSIDASDKNILGGGTFTTALGKITKIEVIAYNLNGLSGDGWSGEFDNKTWTGEAASSVSFSGDIKDFGTEMLRITFTIEL